MQNRHVKSSTDIDCRYRDGFDADDADVKKEMNNVRKESVNDEEKQYRADQQQSDKDRKSVV